MYHHTLCWDWTGKHGMRAALTRGKREQQQVLGAGWHRAATHHQSVTDRWLPNQGLQGCEHCIFRQSIAVLQHLYCFVWVGFFSFYLMASRDCSCWSLVLIPCMVKCIAFWTWFALISLSAKPKHHMRLWKVANAFTFPVNQIFGKKKTILAIYRRF